ncbi:AtpZ/AtpI family protein [uncultured Campylobacter sp.]|uniref:AtpZ/AtpI family protein n=1 Tax=uncultured Campylobacter sp. TaxID=218934 RepID=UPI00260EF54F|nr:AtpZ/AtpI family protein [uncultured Campylobacter sp.]
MRRITRHLYKIIRGANYLSLGISIVVAIACGVFLGMWLQKLTGSRFLFFFCLFIGLAAAYLNVYKVYRSQIKQMKELESDERYKNFKPDFSDEEKEEDE